MRILGVNFFTGTAAACVERMRQGGLLVVPAAPALKDVHLHEGYREALLQADVAIPDSMLMVLIWNSINRRKMPRISGLTYLRELLKGDDLKADTLWVMPNAQSAHRAQVWLSKQGLTCDFYIAPKYGQRVYDGVLLDQIQGTGYRHIVIGIGGGVQERLGLYLKQHLSYLPSIHCIGAAIAFLSGDQVAIPPWADKLGLGWLFRCVHRPMQFVPRYFRALRLVPLLLRYRNQLPPVKEVS